VDQRPAKKECVARIGGSRGDRSPLCFRCPVDQRPAKKECVARIGRIPWGPIANIPLHRRPFRGWSGVRRTIKASRPADLWWGPLKREPGRSLIGLT